MLIISNSTLIEIECTVHFDNITGFTQPTWVARFIRKVGILVCMH